MIRISRIRAELINGGSDVRFQFGTFVLVAAALFCVFTAATSGLAPRAFAAQLGLAISSVDGYNEIRAQYAGFFLMTSGFVSLLCWVLSLIVRRSWFSPSCLGA
jgi:hypothetical protein